MLTASHQRLPLFEQRAKNLVDNGCATHHPTFLIGTRRIVGRPTARNRLCVDRVPALSGGGPLTKHAFGILLIRTHIAAGNV
jgi:hypothetical protein